MLPRQAVGLVVFAHGHGSGRQSPRNRLVADVLQRNRIGTLLLDLESPAEAAAVDPVELERQAARLLAAIDWARRATDSRSLGLHGTGTGGAAAIIGAARRPNEIRALVVRSGRPDLAGPELRRVRAPTLLVVGGADEEIVSVNRLSLKELRAEAKLEIIPGAGHLFEESGAIERVAVLTADWFAGCFTGRVQGAEAR